MTFDEILEKLKPFANRGWIKRFEAVKNKGQKMWLYVVRDITIDTPEVEYIVEDIVRSLEQMKERKSIIRAEMEKLEAEGKLIIDTPEEETKWESRLQKEREEYDEWQKADAEARAVQRKSDLEFLAKKKSEFDSPIANIKQDRTKNTALNAELDKMEKEQVEEVEKTGSVVVSEVDRKALIDEYQKVVGKKIFPTWSNKEIQERMDKHTGEKQEKELTELEKEQEAFIPKPPPKEKIKTDGPKLKEIETDGEVIYSENEEVKPKIETLKLPEDATKRLKDIGVLTVADFTKMDRGQAKQLLGEALYNKHFTS